MLYDADRSISVVNFVAQRVIRARTDFTEFVGLVGLNQEGDRLDIAPMHLAWHRHVLYCWRVGKHALIQAHFGSGKSSSFAVPLLAWMIGRNPQLRCKIVANSQDNSRQRAAGVRRIIESEAYGYVFPHVQPGSRWAEDDFTVTRKGMSLDATVQARPVFGKGIGSRADIILFDDVCDQENSSQPGQRRKVRDTVEQTWLSRLEPGNAGLALWIATPWHIDDTTHHLMQMAGWCSLIQSVDESLAQINQEVHGAGDDYPVETMDAARNSAVG